MDTTPEEQGNLIELLAAVGSLPTPTREGVAGREVLKIWGSTWDELPVFGVTVAESWNLGTSMFINLFSFFGQLLMRRRDSS